MIFADRKAIPSSKKKLVFMISCIVWVILENEVRIVSNNGAYHSKQ